MSEQNPELNKQKEHIQEMFDDISGAYDRLNRFLSFYIDTYWRKKTIRLISSGKGEKWLDVSTGTADVAILAAKKRKADVIGIDISEKMLLIGKQKIEHEKLSQHIQLIQADAEDIPFEVNHFDICTVAFGVRNFEHLEKGLSEMYRCLRPGGKIGILEFSSPQKKPFKWIYTLYIDKVLPRIGKMISKSTFAYQYLPASIEQFPYGDAFLQKLSESGFKEARAVPLTFGIATLYIAIK